MFEPDILTSLVVISYILHCWLAACVYNNVCACVGVCTALEHGGQCLKLNDVVTRDLNCCGWEEGWRERSHYRDSWRQEMAKKTEELRMRWRSNTRKMTTRGAERERDLQFEIPLYRDCPTCNFQAMDRSGLSTISNSPTNPTTHSMPVMFQGVTVPGSAQPQVFLWAIKARPMVPWENYLTSCTTGVTVQYSEWMDGWCVCVCGCVCMCVAVSLRMCMCVYKHADGRL